MKMTIEQEHPMDTFVALTVIAATVAGAFWFFGVRTDREHRRISDKQARARFVRPLTEAAGGLPVRPGTGAKRDFGRR